MIMDMLLVNVYEGANGSCILKMAGKWLALPDLEEEIETGPVSPGQETSLSRLREVAELAAKGRFTFSRELPEGVQPLKYRLQFYTHKQ